MADRNPLGIALGGSLLDDVAPLRMPQPIAPTSPHMGRGQLIAGILADALAGAMGRSGPFAAQMAKQQDQQDEEVQWQRHRKANLEDYGEQQRLQREYATPPQPYRFEDNAGNVWERGPDGQNRRIFTDMAPKQIIQDGMMITVPNPYAAATAPSPPPVIDEDTWNSGTPLGGPTQPASGGFPRYR